MPSLLMSEFSDINFPLLGIWYELKLLPRALPSSYSYWVILFWDLSIIHLMDFTHSLYTSLVITPLCYLVSLRTRVCCPLYHWTQQQMCSGHAPPSTSLEWWQNCPSFPEVVQRHVLVWVGFSSPLRTTRLSFPARWWANQVGPDRERPAAIQRDDICCFSLISTACHSS